VSPASEKTQTTPSAPTPAQETCSLEEEATTQAKGRAIVCPAETFAEQLTLVQIVLLKSVYLPKTMADTLTPLLLDAKKEYTLRLAEVMSPFVIKFIDTTYRTAKKEAGERKALLDFQERLRQVPSWNAAIIEDFTRDIENKYSYFSDLVAAVFVTYVKVLSSIKISSQRPNVKLKLPENSSFVHQVYINTAKNFYENPYAVKDSQQSKAILVLNAIETSVRTMLPLGDVLQAYLSSAVNEDNAINPVLSPAQSVDGNEEEETPPEPSDSESDFEDNEEKVISGVTDPSAPTDPSGTTDPFGPTDNPPVISPINQPFPDDATPPPPPPPPQPTYVPTPPPPTPHQPYGAPQQQQPQHFPRPLFDDAVDGEHQFR
jgi:hypothetical protein